ncbi:MarR family transcriptional regulator [Olsenella sp. CA-Schmier-601-WT-1]|uniref:MarR family transcriptional regulator n=2 Tax=Olsenella porci TaxID=2652279 RepID=A0A6N7XGH5_9ACTN|nr:MarR family transcriptional regulator [Olsenella porci]
MNMGADLGGVVRRDVFELPEWSVREAITNAVVHRSYVERSSVQVALYDDRLEVSSPGGIVRGFSLDRALSGQSRPRNEALAQAFLYMGLIEGWGSGIPRIMHELGERGLRAPEFLDIDGMLRVNMWRPSAEQFGAYLHGQAVTDAPGKIANSLASDNKSDNKDNKSDNNTGVSSEERALLAMLAKDPSITQARMAESFGLSRSTVTLMLAHLQQAGLVRREGSRKAGTWVVVDGDGQ